MRVRTDDPLCEAGQVGVHSVAPLMVLRLQSSAA